MNEWAIGMFAVMVVSAMLLLAVWRELAPAGGLTGRGRWYLAVGLGAGVLAFAAKMLLAGSLSLAPPTLLSAWAARAAPPPGPRAAPATSPVASPRWLPAARTVWQALPTEAPGTLHDALASERIALGERLFHDKALSLDRSVACASCHDVRGRAGTDGQRTSAGIGGQRGTRNAPTVWNAAFQARLFWDGRAASLEEQAKGPPVNPIEMGMPTLNAVVERVRENPRYRADFARVFPGRADIDIDQIAAAIAAYERTLITPHTPYDRFVRGDARALNDSQVRGMALFDQVGCVQCHAGPNFSGASLIGSGPAYRLFPARPGMLDPSLRLQDDAGGMPPGASQGLWRVPSLRNVALTAPYFHNGSVARLEDAVRVMARAQLGLRLEDDAPVSRQAYWSPADHTARVTEPGTMSERDVQDIAAFLRALSDDALLAAALPR